MYVVPYFLSAQAIPFFAPLPAYMSFLFNQGWLTVIMNWTSLVFSSVANLVVPFLLFLASKRYSASAVLNLQEDLQEGEYRGSVQIAIVQLAILIILLRKPRTR
jgi:hypothetical protein